ncbi:MOSC domain-containing protein [Pseudonocardia pini]|uniref:MOSC domain-containing protein n=1 Tax=Pseudonocardia pini TaxID=2758030 RepID=UPI0028AD53CE|nr:MOSC N-terminal beta barrel domain-containing protein [Pseudonocardia pini]
MSLVVSSLARYPVKSCRGESLREAVVEPWGLAGDRRWMITDPDGTFVTARTLPRLVLVHPVPDEQGLTLHSPGVEPLRVSFPRVEPLADVVVWRNRVKATSAGEAAAGWLTAVLGTDVRLVYLDDPQRRPVDPEFGAPGDRVSFADGYPLLLTTDASLAALNALIAEGRNAAEGPVPMVRFRPNVVVSGATPWAEDEWSRLRIGEARFRAVKPCSRCVLTTVDAETGEKGREPLATLARHRRIGSMIVFGTNLIPDDPGAVLRVGDEVEPLG